MFCIYVVVFHLNSQHLVRSNLTHSAFGRGEIDNKREKVDHTIGFEYQILKLIFTQIQ